MKNTGQQFPRHLCVQRGADLDKVLEARVPLNDNEGADLFVGERYRGPDDLFERLQLFSLRKGKKLGLPYMGERPPYLGLEKDDDCDNDLRPETLDQPIDRIQFEVP